MKKLNLNPSHLQVVYLLIFVVLFSFIIYVPTLIKSSLYITAKLIVEEEIIEGILIGFLFILNIIILNLYRNETLKQKELIKKIDNDKEQVRERLDDSYKHIGQINVQIQEIKSIFNKADKFPKTKNDLKKTFRFFSERVFGIVNTEWVLFRIVDSNTQKTIFEQFETRPGSSAGYPHIGNKKIVEGQSFYPYTSVVSKQQNINMLSCCIVPVHEINNDENIFIQAIANEITMIFSIFNYSFHEKTMRN
jgi:hypothetical protein